MVAQSDDDKTRDIYKALRYLDGLEITIGIQGKEAEKVLDGVPLVTVAAANEFGTDDGHIPERSYLRSTAIEESDHLQGMLDKILDAAKSGKSLGVIKSGVEKVGLYAQSKIQNKIVELRVPPNALTTIKRKGSSNPLINTGQLKSSVTYEIKEKK